jgi:hypothetical protein
MRQEKREPGICMGDILYGCHIVSSYYFFLSPKENINKGMPNQKNKKVFGILHNLYYTGPRPIGMMLKYNYCPVRLPLMQLLLQAVAAICSLWLLY